MAEPDTTKALVLRELGRVRALVDATDDDDTDELQRALVRLRELRALVRPPIPLGANAQRTLCKSLKKTLQSRYNNYKNGTKSGGDVRKPPATLRVHYATTLAAKLATLCEPLYHGRLLACEGVSSADDPVGVCTSRRVLDPHNLNFHEFPMDHWYEQQDINETMRLALEFVCDGEERFTIAYVRRHFDETKGGPVHQEIVAFLDDSGIDLEQYRDDLFGVNLHLRCTDCTALSKSSQLHPRLPGKQRYVLV